MKQEVKQRVKGLNIYTDKKNRTIYYNPLTKKAVYIPNHEINTFSMYQYRFIAPMAIMIILSGVLLDYFDISYIYGIIIAAIVFVVYEGMFIRYINNKQPIKRFNKNECTSFRDSLKSESIAKSWARIVIYIALGVLTVMNAYQMKYTGFSLIVCYVIGIICMGYAVFLLYYLYAPKK